MRKNTKRNYYKSKKQTVKGNNGSSDGQKVIWLFDDVDKDGMFAFKLDRIEKDSNLKEIFDKLLDYSSMTWSEVKKQTHDDGKSKNHNLDVEKLSKDALDRVEFKCKENDDSIFSFALQNKLRIIGVRENNFFHVKWYDPNHQFCPSRKK